MHWQGYPPPNDNFPNLEALSSGWPQVVRSLKESGQLEDTILMFTSDNGPRTGPVGTEQVLAGLASRYLDLLASPRWGVQGSSGEGRGRCWREGRGCQPCSTGRAGYRGAGRSALLETLNCTAFLLLGVYCLHTYIF